MAQKRLHFETLQLHVGQEKLILLLTHAQYLSIRLLRMYSTICSMQPYFPDFVMPVTSADLLTPHKEYFEQRVAALESGVAGLAVALWCSCRNICTAKYSAKWRLPMWLPTTYVVVHII